MRIDIVTIFPEFFGVLDISLLGKARERGIIDLGVHNLRDFTHDKHRTVDDTPYGGGAGMVMRPEPWGEALDAAVLGEASAIIFPSPAGTPFTQATARELALEEQLVFACGRYEGIDQRVVDYAATKGRVREISLGDYVLNGGEVAVMAMIDAGETKIFLSTRDTIVRSIMGGALLSLAAGFAVTVSVNTGIPLLGAVLFPVGFIMLYLLGYDLLTGVFVLAPLAWLAKRPGVTLGGVLRNWGLVFVGNFIGAFTVAVLMAIVVTFGFTTAPNAVGEAIGHIGEGRTVGYAEHGFGGMLTLFIRAVLCNWMVSTGIVMAFIAKDVVGKIIAMWMPIMLFFYMGFEHSIVNMFLFPSGLMLGGQFTIMDYLVWNEIPTVLGNLVGGLVFTAIPLYLTYNRTKAARLVVDRRSRGKAPVSAPVDGLDAEAELLETEVLSSK